jgi:hypothetical protein
MLLVSDHWNQVLKWGKTLKPRNFKWDLHCNFEDRACYLVLFNYYKTLWGLVQILTHLNESEYENSQFETWVNFIAHTACRYVWSFFHLLQDLLNSADSTQHSHWKDWIYCTTCILTGFRLDDWDSILGRGWDFSVHCIQIGTGAHPASYSVLYLGLFPKDKVAWSLPLASSQGWCYDCIPPLLHTYSCA